MLYQRMESEFDLYSLVLDRGSLGPSTVTLMALVYVATWGGVVDTVMVMLKLFPGKREASVKSVKSKNPYPRGEAYISPPHTNFPKSVGRSIYHRLSPCFGRNEEGRINFATDP